MHDDQPQTLGDLVELVGDKIATNKDQSLPYIGLEQMAEGSPELLGMLPASASTSMNNVFRPGDILFGKLRPNLRKSLQATFRGYCSTDILVLRAKPEVVPGFAAKLFQWEAVFDDAVRAAEGTKMPRTSWDKLRNFKVPTHDIDQQRRIADILDAADAAIRQTDAVIAKLRQLRAGLLHDLLPHRVNSDSKPINEIAIHVGSGVTPTGGSEVYKTEGVIFFRSQNITFEGLDLVDVAYIDQRTHRAMTRSKVFAHDVLLNITGASIGRCCALPEGLGDANVNQHVCAIRVPRATRVDAVYLSAALSGYIGQSQIDRLNAGSNREGLNYQHIRGFVVPWPSESERTKVAMILEAHDARIRAEESTRDKLKLQKRGLMNDLLTGRVRV